MSAPGQSLGVTPIPAPTPQPGQSKEEYAHAFAAPVSPASPAPAYVANVQQPMPMQQSYVPVQGYAQVQQPGFPPVQQTGYATAPQQHGTPQPGVPVQQGYAMQPMQMQQQPMQQPIQQVVMQQPTSQFRNATPIAALGQFSAPVDCPSCGERAMTLTNPVTGNTTHAWALFGCWLFCLGFIAYLMDGLKDIQHRCGRCGIHLATWHRSGHTEVHVHG